MASLPFHHAPSPPPKCVTVHRGGALSRGGVPVAMPELIS